MKYGFDQVIERRGTDSMKWGRFPADVIPLWVADMDFRSAQPIIQALHERVEHGVFGYGPPTPALRLALRERLRQSYGWDVREGEIVYLPGIVSGLNVAVQAFSEPGDSILVQPPVYFHFFKDPAHHGRAILDPPLIKRGDTYEIDFDGFEKAITGRTRVFILCNPHNPVGRVFRRSELETLAAICLRHRLIICSDEIHCDLLYSDQNHIPIATLGPEVAHNTITLMAPSKSFNIAGLECGYAVIQNETLRRAWQKTSLGIVPWVNIMGHVAALAALQYGQDWLAQVLAYLEGNRDFTRDFVRDNMPGVGMCRMEGTFLAWLDCRASGIPGNPADFFLKQARVGLSDGVDFGKGGDGFVRLNIACPRTTLKEALQRMADALSRL